MPDDLDVNGEPIINPVEERIKSLSGKVKSTAEERDAARAAEEAAKTAQAAAEKERDFYASFSDSAVKYPGASEYKDKIKEKVLAGYSVEDATVSVLNSEGKLVAASGPATDTRTVEVVGQAAGGSAVNQLPDGGTKTPQEMTQAERRQALIDAEKRGEISLT